MTAWVARLAGSALVVVYFRQGVYEFNRLLVQRWAYGERIYCAAFLGMMVGAIVGWWNERLAAALLMAGYILAAAIPFLGKVERPMLGDSAPMIALMLLPFLIVGMIYARRNRVRPSWG